MLVDSHCHLDYPDFTQELDEVLRRGHLAGIQTYLTINTHISRFAATLAVAERYAQVYCTVGTHPHEAAQPPLATVDRLVELSKHPKVVGLGETGLDYFYDKSPRDQQRQSFITHIQAARLTGLPLIIHTRDADDDMVTLLTQEMEKGAFTGVLHCFSSTRRLAQVALDLGLYLSISGIVTFKKSDELQSIVTDIPMDRLLLETDCPYLAPIPFRGKRNEPAYMAHTAQKVADLKGVCGPDLAVATTANFHRLFAKVLP